MTATKTDYYAGAGLLILGVMATFGTAGLSSPLSVPIAVLGYIVMARNRSAVQEPAGDD